MGTDALRRAIAWRDLRDSLARGRRALVLLSLLTALIALGLLSYFSLSLASKAVEQRAEESLATSSSLAALYVQEEFIGLTQVSTSFAERRSLREALAGDGPASKEIIHQNLEDLVSVREGLGPAFLVDWEGILLDLVPPTPGIIGQDFSFRDWYKGVRRVEGPYVSEAFRGAASGEPLVVAIAVPVYTLRADGKEGAPLAIIGSAYQLDTIEALSERFVVDQGFTLLVTDQRGVALTGPASSDDRLTSVRAQEPVARALRGERGVISRQGADGEEIVAYAPLPKLGWTVSLSLPEERALAGVADLRRAVILITALMALLILAGAWALSRLLGLRLKLEAESERLRSNMISTVSHELRTPVTSIFGFAQALATRWETTPEESRRKYASIIEEQAHRLGELIKDILDVSRIESGAIVARSEAVPLTAAVAKAVRGLEEDIAVNCSDLSVRVDPHHLEQMVVNLVVNAIKYGSPPIAVEARAQGDEVVLAVSDHGQGVPIEFVPHLFERFTRASRDAIGTGLGLAIVKGLAEVNHGQVRYERGEDGGARFLLILPRALADEDA